MLAVLRLPLLSRPCCRVAWVRWDYTADTKSMSTKSGAYKYYDCHFSADRTVCCEKICRFTAENADTKNMSAMFGAYKYFRTAASVIKPCLPTERIFPSESLAYRHGLAVKRNSFSCSSAGLPAVEYLFAY